MNDERRVKVGHLSESPRKEHLERAWGATPFTVICLPPRGLISKADFQELVPFPNNNSTHLRWPVAAAWPRSHGVTKACRAHATRDLLSDAGTSAAGRKCHSRARHFGAIFTFQC